MRRGKAFQICCILTLTVFVASGAALTLRLAELRHADTFYAQAAGAGNAAAFPAALAPPETVPPPEDSGGEAALEAPALSAQLLRFAGTYPDAALWLQLPDTPLNYPVMLGTDNRFYLDHLPDGSKNALGSLFLDCRTDADSVHLIVYGHNGAGGKMFGLLKQYESQDYFLAHRTLTAATSDAVYVCPIISVRRVAAGGDAYRMEFGDRGSLTDYIRQAAAESLYQTDVELEAAAGVLTLSTCTGRRDQRLIVQALLPPP